MKRHVLKESKLIKISILIVMSLAFLAFSGCETNEEAVDEPDESVAEEQADDAEDEQEELVEFDVKLYYVNDEYVETGDESLPKFVIDEGKAIHLNDEDTAGYMGAVYALYNVPTHMEGASTLVLKEFAFNGITVSEGVATVDMSSKNLEGSSLVETMFIGQVANTLITSFDEIDKVKFTVDGETSQNLMGHIDASLEFGMSE